MGKFRNPEDYYDEANARLESGRWWRVAWRYVISLLLFLVFCYTALGLYWVWVDYFANGYSGITWQEFQAHVEYRWLEFKAGRLDL